MNQNFLIVSDREYHNILAALRLFQREDELSADIEAIATDLGEDIVLRGNAIDLLIKKLQEQSNREYLISAALAGVWSEAAVEDVFPEEQYEIHDDYDMIYFALEYLERNVTEAFEPIYDEPPDDNPYGFGPDFDDGPYEYGVGDEEY